MAQPATHLPVGLNLFQTLPPYAFFWKERNILFGFISRKQIKKNAKKNVAFFKRTQKNIAWWMQKNAVPNTAKLFPAKLSAGLDTFRSAVIFNCWLHAVLAVESHTVFREFLHIKQIFQRNHFRLFIGDPDRFDSWKKIKNLLTLYSLFSLNKTDLTLPC